MSPKTFPVRGSKRLYSATVAAQDAPNRHRPNTQPTRLGKSHTFAHHIHRATCDLACNTHTHRGNIWQHSCTSSAATRHADFRRGMVLFSHTQQHVPQTFAHAKHSTHVHAHTPICTARELNSISITNHGSIRAAVLCSLLACFPASLTSKQPVEQP